MENPHVGTMRPVAGLLALLLLTVAAFFAGAIHAWRWLDRRGFWTKALAGFALSIPAGGLLAAFIHDPRALAWRRPTGFTPEWRLRAEHAVAGRRVPAHEHTLHRHAREG